MITDIQTDKNLGVLTSAIKKLASEDTAQDIYNLALERQNDLTKVASTSFALETPRLFPLHTPEDAVLSKVYFDHQHTKMAEQEKRSAKEKIDIYLNLYSVPEDMFNTVEEKLASEQEPVFLLPSLESCSVHNKEELTKAGEVFTKEASKLSLPHRVEFAQEFCKVASEWDYVPYPSTIAKYAGVLDTDMANLSYMLEIRAAAASREGKDGDMYTKLAHSVLDVDEKPDKTELTKLAKLIHKMDEHHGFDAPVYDRKFPDAFSIVFNKEAKTEEVTDVPDKSEIVARYGVDALDAVEDEDGNIDENKLKNLERRYGSQSV